MTDAPEQVIKIYRGDDTDWNGETLLNFTVTADFDISDFTAEFLLGGITKKNISLADGGNFEVNFSHEETAQMPWGLNKGILKIFDADKRIKTVTNDILFWVTNEPVGEQTESIIVPVPETSPIQISLQIGGGGGGSAHWGGITGNIENQTDLQAEFADVQRQINAIDGLIPAQASTDNKLADKNFVNSSISTNTSYFIGTFESVAELEAYLGTVTNNDYAFVINSVVTNNGNDWATFSELDAYSKTLLTNFDYAWVVNGSKFDLYRFDIIGQTWELRIENTHKDDVTLNTAYNRYKATVSGEDVSWDYEYTLNNSSFTAKQWAAINSGITSSLVTQIGTNTNNISSLQSDKQPKTLVTPITVEGTQQTTVEGALGAVNTLAGKGLANKATGTNSLSILGGAATSNNSINIGANSSAPTNNYATIVGNDTSAYGYGGVSLGQYAQTAGHGAIAIGHGASVSGGTSNTRCSIAIGGSNANNPSPSDTACAVVSNAASAIQLGAGTNTTSNSFQVYSYPMLDGTTGKIPTARLNSTEISAMGMPSGMYEALTLGSSGDSYTAPGNGYYYIYIPVGSNANTQLIYVENVGKPCVSTSAPGTLTGIACTLPVLSGDTVKIYYVRQGTSSTLRFYYADGNPGGN